MLLPRRGKFCHVERQHATTESYSMWLQAVDLSPGFNPAQQGGMKTETDCFSLLFGKGRKSQGLGLVLADNCFPPPGGDSDEGTGGENKVQVEVRARRRHDIEEHRATRVKKCVEGVGLGCERDVGDG